MAYVISRDSKAAAITFSNTSLFYTTLPLCKNVSRGLAVFAGAWLSDWLAEISADLRESGSALEALRDDELYKSTYFTLLFNVIMT